MLLFNDDIYRLKPCNLSCLDRQSVYVYLWKHHLSRHELTQAASAVAPSLVSDETLKLTDKRFIEKLSIRLLFAKLLNVTADAIAYHPSGRPYLKDFPYEISVSHTAHVYAVSISKLRHGIDVEKWGSKALNVAKMYVNEKELGLLTSSSFSSKEVAATLIWSAKEAVYKYKDISGLSFSDSTIVQHDSESNNLLAHLPQRNETAYVNFKSTPDCILTCSCGVQFAIK